MPLFENRGEPFSTEVGSVPAAYLGQRSSVFPECGVLICKGFQIELVIKKQDFIVEVLGLVEPLCMSKQDIVFPDCDRIVRYFLHLIAPLIWKSDIV